jgi:phosphatidyl-myo-inositol dimannoside synthase
MAAEAHAPNKPIWIGIFGSLMAHGGVERANRHMAAALALQARQRQEEYRIFCLNDPRGNHAMSVGGLSFRFSGFARHKLRLATVVMWAASKIRVACIGHAYLAPLGLSIRVLNPGARYLVATHGIEVWQPLGRLRALALRRADRVISPSRFTHAQAVRFQKVRTSKAVVLPWGLEPAFYQVSTQQAAISHNHGSTPTILTVSRISPSDASKGIDTIICALPRVIEQVPQVRYVVLGDGDDRRRLEQLADAKRVRRHVSFIAGATDAQVTDHYRGCDLFAMPSFKEGFGLVFLEAMAFSKPVIGGNYGGTPDLIRDGSNGFLLERDDVDGLSQRITLLLNNPELRARMGEAGRRLVVERYTFERFMRRFENVLTVWPNSSHAHRLDEHLCQRIWP